MTLDDKPRFLQAFNRLTVALREKDPDVAQMQVYFDALKDLEIEFIELAGQQMARDGGAEVRKPDDSPHWFPKTSEWRARAARVEIERTKLLSALLRKQATPLCQACGDTSWRPSESQPDRVVPCECRKLRRLEVLGRRPLPELLSGEGA